MHILCHVVVWGYRPDHSSFKEGIVLLLMENKRFEPDCLTLVIYGLGKIEMLSSCQNTSQKVAMIPVCHLMVSNSEINMFAWKTPGVS